jgi:glyoxylase-like metal-dependent hydrolase (beta-lactamase superfamily II)
MKGPVEIAPGVHGLGSEYVNWYLVEEGDRLTAVDAGLPGFAKHLDDDLRALGRRRSDVAAVVLTHSDADHTGIANQLRDGGARVLVHSADEGTLAKPRPKTGDASPRNLLPYLRRRMAWRLIGHMARHGGARPQAVAGAETYADGDVLDVPGSPRVVHTPGHTPGHCALLFEAAGALFVGDALCTFNPLTGERGTQLMPFPLNVNNEACRESLGRIERLDAQVLLPGHGDPARETPAAAAARARTVR